MRKKIMLIMPEMDLRVTFADFLIEMGYHVDVLEDPLLALPSTNRYKPNLILCYEKFVNGSALDVAGVLKAKEEVNQIPFVMVTPRKRSENSKDPDFGQLKIDALMHLPVGEAEFYGQVTHWLEADEPMPLPSMQPPQNKKTPCNGNGDSNQWRKGTVSPASMGRLFYNLIRSNSQGVVLIKGERRKMKVVIEGGQIIDVKSNYIRDDTLGKYLMRINKISDEQNRKSLKFARDYNVPQGEAFLQMDILDKKMLDHYITEHKVIKLLNLFQRRWYKSKFVFNSGDVTRNGQDFCPTPIQKILSSGILNIARKKDMYDTFFRNDKENTRLRITENFDRVARELDLGPAQVDQAMRIKNKSIEQVKTDRSDQFESNLRLAFLMVLSKGMTFA